MMQIRTFEDQSNQSQYYPAQKISAPGLHIPEGKRLPFKWNAIAISGEELRLTTELHWDMAAFHSGPARLRITVALDVREEKLIEVFLLQSERLIGVFDIKYAYVFQPFEILLNRDDVSAALKEGIGLRMKKGREPLWIFYDGSGAQDLSVEFMPHLLPETEGGRINHFYQCMGSMASIQPFGWMEGCVLDGLMDLKQITGKESIGTVIEKHLEKFFDENRNLYYENPRSEPADSKVYSIEGTLPFAVLAQVWPDHPGVDTAIDFWKSHLKADGSIQDKECISAEGAYTVAYPLAVISQLRKSDDLAELSVKQLMNRKKLLTQGNDLYLRYYQDGSRTFRNWGRAFAWYMLGMIRTLIALGSRYSVNELENEFRRISGIAMSYQHQNGLWTCFLDEEDTGIDTSGSAGIAAALAKGATAGILPDSAFNAAVRALEGLKGYLTPDGFLSGVAQSNRGGEALQKSGYRVISQMGMGLMLQLAAEVSKGSNQ